MALRYRGRSCRVRGANCACCDPALGAFTARATGEMSRRNLRPAGPRLHQFTWEKFLSLIGDPHSVSRMATTHTGRSLLHLAVLDNHTDMIELLSKDHTLATRHDAFGLTPLDLSNFLDRRPTAELSYPIYESRKLFESILLKTTKAKLDDKIPPEKIWMGIYYNREIERNLHPAFSIQKIDDEIGYGVFANQRIAPCSYIGEYTGIIQERKPIELKNELYCLRLTTWDMGRRNFCINAANRGNFTRFINHSAKPNIALHSVYWKGLPRMIFVALQEIRKGTQLTFDYGDLFWKEFHQPPKML